MKPKLLITAFEPFGGDTSNVTDEIVRALSADAATNENDITYLTLPVSRDDALAVLIEAIEGNKPDTVLCLGQANDRAEISVERVAINLCCYRIPDNNGEQLNNQPVVMDGPAAYFATLPVDELVNGLTTDGIAAEVSYSAGTYVCNSVFYGLMHYLEQLPAAVRAGFVHIPRVPAEPSSEASVNLTVMTRAVVVMLNQLRRNVAPS